MIEIVAFLVACLVALGLSIATRRLYGRDDAIALSICLLGSWLISKMIAHGGDMSQVFSTTGDWQLARQTYPAIDAVVVSIAGALYFDRMEAWKLGFIATVVAKLGIDLSYALAGFPTDVASVRAYQAEMNTGFALELVFVFLIGGWVIADRYFGPRLPRWSRRPHALSSGIVEAPIR